MITDSSYHGKIRLAGERSKTIVGAALVVGTMLLSGVSVARAQLYGVRRTAVAVAE